MRHPFEEGRRRGLRQAAKVVREHFGGDAIPEMMKPLIYEILGVAHVATPPGQSEDEEKIHDAML
jgi:hypothetical protein